MTLLILVLLAIYHVIINLYIIKIVSKKNTKHEVHFICCALLLCFDVILTFLYK